jgi:hypothetical protein
MVMMNYGRTIFTITEADLQSVAMESFGQILHEDEIKAIEVKLKSDRIFDWASPLQVAILEVISTEKHEMYDEFDEFVLAD